MIFKVIDVFSCWIVVHHGRHHNSTVWVVTPHCIVVICEEWNVCTFDGVERSVLELKSLFF